LSRLLPQPSVCLPTAGGNDGRFGPTATAAGPKASDVLDFDHLDIVDPLGRAHLDHVAFLGAQQRLGDRRDPAHMALVELDLVDADDLDGALLAAAVGVGHGRAEEDLLGRGPSGRIDHLGVGQPLAEIADAAVDLAQPLLAVDVVAVLRAVAVAGGPAHDLHHFRPLLAHQAVELLAHPREARGRHVVLRSERQAAGLLREVVLVRAVVFLGEGFAHAGPYSKAYSVRPEIGR